MKSLRRIGVVAVSVIALGLVLVALTWVMTARAQDMTTGMLALPVACKPFEVMAKDLSARFGEAQAFAARTRGGAALTIFVSPEGGWTAVLLRRGLPACVILAGEGWSWRPPEEPAS